ncbi:zinc ABC transporter substrate-binding protein [Vitreoscilla massiliensis]|uniref:Zinc ABC transporter substrate-binding protein n=1 Tax=Vitreoscilla massiliensis TaxID=1689272 RepID=A0ABY4E106_9NEIS|nr:zinc ABC transporter substrate-binding protein [Vitreoscilla massiliensis]UOO88939.1 zinc ABC transporter substrate-binding protein [Vitreoscilla massiliensis]
MKTRTHILAAVVLASLGLQAALAAPTRQVTTSFSILENITQSLLGKPNNTQVHTLVGINGNSHTYQLRARDVQTMQKSQLIIFNGLGFESAALQRAAQSTRLPIVEAGAGLQNLLRGGHDHHDEGAHDHAGETAAEHAEHEHEALAQQHAQAGHEHDGHEHNDEHEHAEEHGHADEHAHESEDAAALDPHVWLDPLNMPLYTANISKALIKQQPEQALRLSLQWQLYQLKLAQLHGETVRKFAAIPVAKRKVLTSHAAFAYMGRRYQIQFYAPVSGGHEAEASAKTLVDLIRQVRSEHIQAVFVENVNDARLLQQLGRETGLQINGKLYSDALSSDAPDYFSFYRHNVDLLVQALQH